MDILAKKWTPTCPQVSWKVWGKVPEFLLHPCPVLPITWFDVGPQLEQFNFKWEPTPNLAWTTLWFYLSESGLLGQLTIWAMRNLRTSQLNMTFQRLYVATVISYCSPSTSDPKWQLWKTSKRHENKLAFQIISLHACPLLLSGHSVQYRFVTRNFIGCRYLQPITLSVLLNGGHINSNTLFVTTTK